MKFQNHIGLDIGATTIKLVQLGKDGNKFRLQAIAACETPNLPSEQKDNAEVESIKKLIKDSGAIGKKVVVSLPESQVYTRVVEMPFLQEPELTSAIKWQAEQYIPVPLADVILKHQVLSLPEQGVPEGKMRVLLVAAPNHLIDHLLSILSKVGLEVLAVETEIFAVSRALVGSEEFSPTTLIVNFGTDTTSLAVLRRGDLSLTRSVPVGGMAMTRALVSSLGLDQKLAEEHKKTYGLNPGQLEGKIISALTPVLQTILEEVKKVIAFYETRNSTTAIKRLVLSGATALMPGLVNYFAQTLQMEVQLGNPFAQVTLNDKEREVVLPAGPIFAAAVGLAAKPT